MPQQELNIRIKLTDELSAGLQKVQANLNKIAQKGTELGRSMKMVGREISQVGTTLTFMGAAITTPLMLAFKSAEKYSLAVHNQMERLRNITLNLKVSIAEALVPVIERITNILGQLLNAWNSLTPVQQQFIVQGAFMTGVFLTIGGAITILIGRLVRLGGIIISLGAKFAIFTTLHPVIFGVGLAIGTLIFLMFRFREVALPVLNAIEVAWNSLYGTIRLVESGIYKVLEALTKFKPKWSNTFKEASELAAKQANEAFNKVSRIMSGEEGDLYKGFEKFKENIANLFDALKTDKAVVIKPILETFNFMEELARGTAQAMTNAFSQLFFNVFTGQMKEIRNVFADFGRAILQVLSQALARFVLIRTIGSILPGLGKFFHQGGIVKAHSGLLARDEVPIIAQAGEGVVSRRGMSILGAENLHRLNRGQNIKGGDIIYNPVVVIQAWDTRDIVRNSKTIEAIIADALRRNSRTIRDSIKEYS